MSLSRAHQPKSETIRLTAVRVCAHWWIVRDGNAAEESILGRRGSRKKVQRIIKIRQPLSQSYDRKKLLQQWNCHRFSLWLCAELRVAPISSMRHYSDIHRRTIVRNHWLVIPIIIVHAIFCHHFFDVRWTFIRFLRLLPSLGLIRWYGPPNEQRVFGFASSSYG